MKMGFRVMCFLFVASLLVAPGSSNPREKSAIRKKAFSPSKPDMASSGSVAAPTYQEAQSVEGKRYGYPYQIAPTLPPFLQHRLDTDEKEAVYGKIKAYGSRIAAEVIPAKKSHAKKTKIPAAERRQGFDGEDSSSERRFETYREPTYRNLFELESIFRARRIEPSLGYGYSAKPAQRPAVSPRDPYLSPTGDHGDIFYPSVPKYKQPFRSGGRISYGAGAYDSGYDSPPGHPSGYDSPSSVYDYNESYSIESNKPIVGDIRKRLLDFAGASDLYEGEPDYLREAVRNRNKYGSLGNHYHPYGGPANDFRDFHYAESKPTGAAARGGRFEAVNAAN